MKKILISLSIIATVAAVVVGGTMALFNDMETSTGNIFTAGSIDLKVDHLAQTYNGDDCETCSLILYSGDGGAQVTAGVNTVITSFPYPALLVTPTTITTQYWITHPTAKWIWATDPTLAGDAGINGAVTYTFEDKFNWWGGAVSVDLLMNVAADNQYQILLNGTSIASGLGSAQYTTLDPIAEGTFLAAVQSGENTLTFIVTNLSQTNPAYNTPLNNPGGLLYYLKVERDSEDCNANSAFLQNCTLFGEKDLATGDHFWMFDDVKPGDYGTNLISLHVSSNDAFACLITNNINDQENDIVDPETAAGDLPNVGNQSGYGELSPFIKAFAWYDDGDGVYEGETVISGPNVPLSTAIGTITLPTSSTKNIGVAWCAGTQTVVGNVISCNGASMGDIAQTDSFTADVTAYAVQQRNNGDFNCARLIQ
ncbi:MAG: SipW-dependent-type signal peptide-containing protein [Patescibacteria group bacterium]|jgi:predicted ribosomally synthesized peptide with SipW-like signal peptide